MNPAQESVSPEQPGKSSPMKKSNTRIKTSIINPYTPAICTFTMIILLIINLYSGKLSVKQRRFIVFVLILIYALIIILYLYQGFKLKTFLGVFLIINGLLLINNLIVLFLYYKSEDVNSKKKSHLILRIYELLYDKEIIPISVSFITFFTGNSLTFIIIIYIIMILISIAYTVHNLVIIYKKSQSIKSTTSPTT